MKEYESSNPTVKTSADDYYPPAVDAVDFGAKVHDLSYDLIGARGADDLYNDWGATPADLAAFNAWDDVVDANRRGESDPHTGQKITGGEMRAAIGGMETFKVIAWGKIAKISKFMIDNHSNAAQKEKGGIMPDRQAQFNNYLLFLKIYMDKVKLSVEDNGKKYKVDAYKRKAGMWSGNKPKKG